jgi:hypothetical protein
MSPVGDIITERAARELAKVEPARREEVLAAAGPTPTARSIREAAAPPVAPAAEPEYANPPTDDQNQPDEAEEAPQLPPGDHGWHIQRPDGQRWGWNRFAGGHHRQTHRFTLSTCQLQRVATCSVFPPVWFALVEIGEKKPKHRFFPCFMRFSACF